MNERLAKAEALFHEALDLLPQQREAFLQRGCANDPDLRDEIAALLRAADTAERWIKDEIHGPVMCIGDYELIEEIARGGMGVVYKARQVSLNRMVALKCILSGQFASKEQILRFQAEAQAAANLRHPNIVAVHDIDEHNGIHYFSMDYVRGRDLATIIRDGPLACSRATRYLVKIARAIDYAHRQGTLHRDLKPSNVLIDIDDEPRVTDFGVAKRLNCDLGLTVTGAVVGTPKYMPPERLRGSGHDNSPRGDIYSLGAVLYHLVVGRPPFAAATMEETIIQVLENEPAPLRMLNAAIPSDVETICLKCLQKDPAERYASAGMVADELERFLNGEPITSRAVIGTKFHSSRWADESYGRRSREDIDLYITDRSHHFHVLRSFYSWHLRGRSNLRVCDLGCGDGALAAQLVDLDPSIQLICLDGSQAMIEAAKQRFASRANVRYIAAPFEALIRREIDVGATDVFISSFAIHHLDLAEKTALFQVVIEHLEPGGWLLIIDAVLPDHESFTDWHYELWREQIVEREKLTGASRSFQDAPDLARAETDNKPSTLRAQLKALRAAGFEEVECHYRNGIFAIYTGRKPLHPNE